MLLPWPDDLISCIVYLCAAARRLEQRSNDGQESAPGAVGSSSGRKPQSLLRGGGIPVSHAIPAKHCGTLDIADNKSQIFCDGHHSRD